MRRRANPGQIPLAEGFTSERLDAFTLWITERGRSQDTADLYRGNLLLCAAEPKGLTHRLVHGSLAPNTRRTYLAALSQWAIFTEDATLTKRLSSIRLPPARRVAPKVPLADEEWKALIKHLRTCDHPRSCPVMRDIHLLMALRGIRVGDVLRIGRSDLVSAIKTGTLSFVAKGNRRLEYAAKPVISQLEAILDYGDREADRPLGRPWKHIGDLVGKGKPKARYHRVRRALLHHASELEIEGLHCHRLRRTYATAYLKQLAGDPQGGIKLQKHMQWANLNTALSYVDAVSGEELDAVGDKISQMLEDDE